MKLFKFLLFSFVIWFFTGFVFSPVNVYAALNNANVYSTFFYPKGPPALKNINTSLKKAFQKYIHSGKPYFVLSYTKLKKIPYFNFNKKINLQRIKKLGKLYHSSYIITGSISRFGSSYELHAMMVNIEDIYRSKTYEYTGTGKSSLKKNIYSMVRKAAGIIARHFYVKHRKKSIPVTKKIYAVQVKGNIRVGTGFILNLIKIKSGEKYSIGKINKSIQSLYKTGYFKNVMANVKQESNGLLIAFIVSERPLIKYIKYTGNGSVSIKKIKKIINVKKETPYSSYKAFKALKILRFIYSAEGYYNAKIKLVKKKIPGNYIGLHFFINQNAPVMVKKVEFKGNSSFPSSKLQGVTGIGTVNMFTWLTGAGKFKKARLNSDIIKLLSFYYNHGYLNVTVKKPEIIFSKNKKFVTVLIRIHQGHQYRISQVRLIITHLSKLSKEYKAVFKLLKIKAGNVFNRKMVEKAIIGITKYFTYKGYAFASVQPVIKINRKNSSVIIKLIVHKGKIARFGKITITGNTLTYSYVVLRALVLRPGEKYNPKLIKASRQNLKNLKYFKHVTITTEKVPGKNILNVKVHVEEKNTGKFTIGGGYSTATRFMAITSISEANLFGTGISASLNIQVGGPYQSYSLNIFQPSLFGKPVSLGLSIYDTFNALYYEFAYRSVGASVTVGFPLYKNVLTEFVRYLFEQDTSVVIPGLIQLNPLITQGKILTSEVSLTTVYNTLNNPIFPTSGDNASFRVSYAGYPIGGNDDFLRIVVQESHYIPLWWETSLVFGAQAGYVTPTRSGVPLPIYQRFFVGGIMNTYPLLGFMYDSVGPSENGLLYGGTRIFTVMAKYLIPIVKKMHFYGFLWWNAGNDWATSQPVNPLGLVQAAGIGFNWYSPFGPIEITYGKILGTPINGNSPTRIQFSLGTGFGGF